MWIGWTANDSSSTAITVAANISCSWSQAQNQTRFPAGLVQRESGVGEREGQVRDGDSPSVPSVRR